MDKQDLFEGYVIFILQNEGSKSEHYTPILMMKHDGIIEIFKEGDNPYLNESLRPYHLSYCQLTGFHNSAKNIITIATIQKVDDPFAKFFGSIDNPNCGNL